MVAVVAVAEEPNRLDAEMGAVETIVAEIADVVADIDAVVVDIVGMDCSIQKMTSQRIEAEMMMMMMALIEWAVLLSVMAMLASDFQAK